MFRLVARSTLTLALFSSAACADDIPRPEHPRPDAVRRHWANLNGKWDFRFDAKDEGREAKWFEPGAAGFDRSITVPFGWESELSGVHELRGPKVGWYRRTFEVPADFPKGERVRLHFGAVDWQADVWVNGKHVASHEGGYSPFFADVTDAVDRGKANTVVVRAFDPTDPSLPTGKQVGWYTTTSGIWQTVWLESAPRTSIVDFTLRPKLLDNGWHVDVAAEFPCFETGDYKLSVVSDDPTVVPTPAFAQATRIVGEGSKLKAGERTSLNLGIGVKDGKAWTPETPHLYDITLELKGPDSSVDRVRTYFGLRSITRGKLPGENFERIFLNGKPIYLRGALDQSFNPKGVYTAPDDAFLKNDIELAKRMGTNFLRIHIKPEEPRRLYWADRLGMLVMEDMPNTWEQNSKARKAWEATMREVVARDKNHPSIFAWVDFNETWGLGSPERYKADQDTQAWVRAMVAETRKLDPTRLVEDNSPCNYDHVEGSDLNSWHFYIDDHAGAKRHIEEVVERSTPGSSFNYCPGQAMNSAPLINSEYGSVSAGGGDRDVSWGFRDLTTQLRRHPKIQGYIYTELTDIEWEHNGFADYDRTAKDFGYSAFVPGMTPADLQGADFVGYDAPPAIAAKPGDLIEVPVFVSHYSDRKEAPVLKWWITGTDDAGKPDQTDVHSRPVEWTPYGVTMQKRIKFRLHGAFTGAVALTLEDSAGKRIAANFVNLIVQPEKPAPRVERPDEHHAVLRFSPADYSKASWSGPLGTPEGKVHGQGKGSFVYKLKVPESVVKAGPKSLTLLLEAGAKAGREKVDWAERRNAQDYPQTDATKWASTLEISTQDGPKARFELTDDAADARGVLSHAARIEHGSYGEMIRCELPITEALRKDLVAGRPLVLTLAVPNDATRAGGLAIFGATTGAYPFDPTLTMTTDEDLPEDLGVKADAAVAIDTAEARRVALLRPGDSNQGRPTTWRYSTAEAEDANWNTPAFDDAKWATGRSGFGTPSTPALQERTAWDTPTIRLRTTIEVPRLGPDDQMLLHVFHDEDVTIYVNGRVMFEARGYVTAYRDIPLSAEQRGMFSEGKNTIAVECRQTGGGQGVDVGLSLIRGEGR